jgi:hypothetical protein
MRFSSTGIGTKAGADPHEVRVGGATKPAITRGRGHAGQGRESRAPAPS